MPRSAPFFFIFILICTAVACAFWLGQPVSNQELLANYSKAQDFFAAAQSVKGLPWWSPMFLQGTSLAPTWSIMASNVLLLAFSTSLGFLIGPKVAVAFYMALGAMGVFCFLKKYANDDWCAFAGGVLFLLCPSFLTRAVAFEHFVVGFSMALLPWAFWGLLEFFRKPSKFTAILSSLLFAAVFLAYGKTGLMALPVLILFCATEYFGRPIEQRPSSKLIAFAAGIFVLLALIPNFPALRETKFVAMFDFAPFAGWQRAFSSKSALGWIDRAGCLTEGMGTLYAPTTGNGGTYMGLVPFAFLAIALFRGTLHKSTSGHKARTFLSLGMFAFWLSFGPKNVLGGQMEFLTLAFSAPDFTPALGWFFLVAQVWIIFKLVPSEWPGSKIVATILSIIYLFVPGFRLIELLPIYRNIRAPFDFYQITGTICIIFAAAIVIRILFGQIRPSILRSGMAAAVFALAILDIAPYARPFFQASMNASVFKDFLKAEDFLKNSPVSGRVFPFSGRYFYLLTPLLSGRPLITEAFNSYLQQRGVALLQGAAFLSDDQLQSYMRIAGVSHILVDKTDVDTPREIQERLHKLFPTAFENSHFLVLENKDSLGSGFLAQDFVQTASDAPEVATAALGGAKYDLAVIQFVGLASEEPGLRGNVVDGRIEALSKTSLKEGVPFERIMEAPNETYERVTFQSSEKPGWMILNQAWHPDWTATVGNNKAEIHRAFLGFSAVRTDGKDIVTFRFDPPWWYPVCVAIGIISWAGCSAFVLIFPLFPSRSRTAASPTEKQCHQASIQKPLAIIPTYNEAAGIVEILKKTLEQSNILDVLVVDDGSPDGTATLVQSYADQNPRVYLLKRDQKLGLGSAYKAGFTWAKVHGFDAVVEMDADLSHDPADIPRLLEELNGGADAAIGSRYLGGVRVMNWPEHRLMLSAFASKFVRFATGLPLTDATSGFKALRISALEKIDEDSLRTQGYGFQIELHHALWKSGARMVEVPIVFTERREGQTKMTLGIAIEAFTRVLHLSKGK